MKYKVLRAYMKSRNVKERQEISKELVIDGKSFFHSSYKNSGCQYLLGGEYDRYASYLRKLLSKFRDISCYICFNGAMHEDIQGRLELHQRKINEASSIIKHYKEEEYTDVVIFQTKVIRDVLDELGIKYLVCEYSSLEALVTLAKYKRCPVLTNNIEICLYNVACVVPHSLEYNEERNVLFGDVYSPSTCLKYMRLGYDMIPTFLTLADQDLPAYPVVSLITNYKKDSSSAYIYTFLRWITRHRKSNKEVIDAVKPHLTQEEFNTVLAEIVEKQKIFSSRDKTAVNYFSRPQPSGLVNAEDWFVRGVANGTICNGFINLKNIGLYSGSWLVSDHTREDAMLPALNIVFYSQALLTQSSSVEITFVGRKHDESLAWKMEKKIAVKLPKTALLNTKSRDLLELFIDNELPGFSFRRLTGIPEEFRLTVISLAYYLVHREVDIAYAVILSSVILGPVTEEVGVIKRSLVFAEEVGNDIAGRGSNLGLTRADCLAAAASVLEMFYFSNIDAIFETDLLHTLAEFQHCWYLMNSLNKLVGSPVKCTKFHEAYNGTFVYNIVLFLRGSPDPLKKVRTLLGNSSVFKLFEKIVVKFKECLLSVQRV